MEALVDLEPEAYREAQRLAAERGQSIGKVLSDVLLGHRTSLPKSANAEPDAAQSSLLGDKPLRSYDQPEADLSPGAPAESSHGPELPKAVVTQDRQGFPQVDIGRALTLEEIRAAVEVEEE